MPWIELKPGKAGLDLVTMSRSRHGGLIFGLSALVTKRNKIGAETRFRILADLDTSPRVLRLVIDAQGPFRGRLLRGDSMTVRSAGLPGLGHIPFVKAECEFDEMTDEKGRLVIEIELPKALQAPDRPLERKPPHAGANGQSANVRR